MSEIPVDLFEETPETVNIMKNLGSLPIQIRHAQQQSVRHHQTRLQHVSESGDHTGDTGDHTGDHTGDQLSSSQTNLVKSSPQLDVNQQDSNFSDGNQTVIIQDDQSDLQLVS